MLNDQLDLFVEEMRNKEFISQKDSDDIKSYSDLFITAAEQNTPDPSLQYLSCRDEVSDEMHELLIMWLTWRQFTGKDKLI